MRPSLEKLYQRAPAQLHSLLGVLQAATCKQAGPWQGHGVEESKFDLLELAPHSNSSVCVPS